MEPTEAETDRDEMRELRPRIGKRQSVGLPARWRVPTGEPATTRRRRRRSKVPASGPAIAHDLSISGARLLLPAEGSPTEYRQLEIEIGGAWATVQVTWADPAPDPAAVWCGVMFVHPDAAFLGAVTEAMAAAPPAPT